MEKDDILPEIYNWKLREVIHYVKIVNEDSVSFGHELMQKLGLPISDEYIGIIRGETHIDWNKMPNHYEFCFDKIGIEEKIKKAFEVSELNKAEHLIITYGWKEPAIMIPTRLFFEDWEGFIRSTLFETLIFSENYSLIMEVSRDYHLHSNFLILKE